MNINDVYNCNQIDGLSKLCYNTIDLVYLNYSSLTEKIDSNYLLNFIANTLSEDEIDKLLEDFEHLEKQKELFFSIIIGQCHRILKNDGILFIDFLKEDMDLINKTIGLDNDYFYKIYEKNNKFIFIKRSFCGTENVQKYLNMACNISFKMAVNHFEKYRKPIYELIISNLTKSEDTVVNVFCDWQVLNFCNKNNRKFIGFEENKLYCEDLKLKLGILSNEHLHELEKLSTGALMSYLNKCRISSNQHYFRKATKSFYSMQEIKQVLDNREHYYNKKERKKIRQIKAQKKIKNIIL